MSLAGGATYMEASQSVRMNVARHFHEAGRELPWRPDTIDHGQLAATWVETYADVVLDGSEDDSWPDVVLVDSTRFWRYVGNGQRQEAFHLLCAYGYDAVDAAADADAWQLVDPVTGEVAAGRSHGNGRLLRAVAMPRSDTASWTEFFRSWPGCPEVIVGDYAQEIRAAVRATWPAGPGRQVPEFVRCRWHLLQNLQEAIVDDLIQRDSSRGSRPSKVARAQQHPLFTGAAAVFQTSEDWHTFREAAWLQLGLCQTGEDRLPQTLRWMRENELLVLCQIARRRERLGPESTGPLEAEIATFRGRLGRRAQSLANKARTDLLLRLLVAGRRGEANEQVWAERVRQYLLALDGQAPAQRSLVSAGGTRTL